ncbi:hypothetical protein BESB_058410 [Besnoitia besnoiti]|uniref:MIR domain-containing protein n=1 Tax=Besnoitia besnoiti TaxID=94643 RepID=A0A2A9MCK3_BESBE|nr:hypothetical protein BESB_058410 [Besnoitia besnoiti]PFH34954.1 hypothetical protein BESB_058410 [Besnoitia besnoiti]
MAPPRSPRSVSPLAHAAARASQSGSSLPVLRRALSSALIIFFVFSLHSCPAEGARPKNGRPVTYGSSVLLINNATGFKLFSGKISWGSGSGQQAVTAMPSSEKVTASNVLWTVSPPLSANRPRPLESAVLARAAAKAGESPPSDEPAPALLTEGAAGEPVRCNSVVVLEHGSSGGTLQAMSVSSPISNQREVSVGSGRDERVAAFKVICGNSKAEYWLTGDAVTFEHVHLRTNLQAKREHAFTQQNCGRGCPIAGHIEVSVSTEKSRSSWGWTSPPTSGRPKQAPL